MNIMPQQVEMFVASQIAERLGGNPRLMEMVLERRNMFRALKRVRSNKGAPGVDGMTVTQLGGYLKRHWLKIKEELLNGTYNPLPVRRKEIAKPDGGVRLLGIPTVLDRLIQQAMGQILEQVWDPTFSESSFGFRPKRCQRDAILQAKGYLLEGYTHVVDMDLSKFFDRVNHDRLMSRLAERVQDKRVLKLIRKYLTAGTMIGGLVSPSVEGTPQGGPLSPLLSNIVLDELDKELEARGHCFVRYADDFMIYTKSSHAAQRVKKSITVFITGKLKLKVNEEKSAVSRPWLRKYLGFTFIQMYGKTKIRIHAKSIKRFKERVRGLTRRKGGKSLYKVIEDLNNYLRGWWNYYRLTEAKHILNALNKWIIRRLRCVVWKQWHKQPSAFQDGIILKRSQNGRACNALCFCLPRKQHPRTKVRNLKKLGIPHEMAVRCGNARKKCWRMSKVRWINYALPPRYFLSRGLYLPGV